MSVTPSYEYEVLHQFEAIFRDGEHKTQAATRDYQRVWENVINNPPEDGVTPVVVYRMNGRTCAAIAGLDDLVDNEECAMEIARLAVRVAELEAERDQARRELAALIDWRRTTSLDGLVYGTRAMHEVVDLRAERDRLKGELEEAEEAIRYFATKVDLARPAKFHPIDTRRTVIFSCKADGTWNHDPVCSSAVRRAMERGK